MKWHAYLILLPHTVRNRKVGRTFKLGLNICVKVSTFLMKLYEDKHLFSIRIACTNESHPLIHNADKTVKTFLV